MSSVTCSEISELRNRLFCLLKFSSSWTALNAPAMTRIRNGIAPITTKKKKTFARIPLLISIMP